MIHLSWNEIRDRASRFRRDHAGDRSEAAEKQTFWNEFFTVFGFRRASVASFEENVRNLKGNQAAIDLLWKGRLIVEHESRGENTDYSGSRVFDCPGDIARAGAATKSRAPSELPTSFAADGRMAMRSNDRWLENRAFCVQWNLDN